MEEDYAYFLLPVTASSLEEPAPSEITFMPTNESTPQEQRLEDAVPPSEAIMDMPATESYQFCLEDVDPSTPWSAIDDSTMDLQAIDSTQSNQLGMEEAEAAPSTPWIPFEESFEDFLATESTHSNQLGLEEAEAASSTPWIPFEDSFEDLLATEFTHSNQLGLEEVDPSTPWSAIDGNSLDLLAIDSTHSNQFGLENAAPSTPWSAIDDSTMDLLAAESTHSNQISLEEGAPTTTTMAHEAATKKIKTRAAKKGEKNKPKSRQARDLEKSPTKKTVWLRDYRLRNKKELESLEAGNKVLIQNVVEVHRVLAETKARVALMQTVVDGFKNGTVTVVLQPSIPTAFNH